MSLVSNLSNAPVDKTYQFFNLFSKKHMLEYFGLAAGIITFLSYFPYLKDIVHGAAKPERASWFIWIILGSIAFFSQLAEGAKPSLWLVGMDTLGGIITFIFALIYGSGSLNKRDIIGLLFVSLGLILWYFTRHAAIALIIIILVDSIGTILTVIKSYKDPGSETMTIWLCVALAGVLAMLSVGKFSPVLLLYPFNIFLANFSIPVAMLLGKRKQNSTSL